VTNHFNKVKLAQSGAVMLSVYVQKAAMQNLAEDRRLSGRDGG
jgi:hypothetical protein